MSVGIKEIAIHAGVSPSTVSLALRGSNRIPETTKTRIKQIASELNYSPNLLARGLAGQKTQTIGILVPKLRDLYIVEIIAAQENWLKQKGFASLLTVTHCEPDIEHKAISDLLCRGVDGLVFNYVPQEEHILREIQKIVSEGTPVSFLGTTTFEIEGVDEVTWNFVKAGYEIGQYLISLGHKRIAYIGLDFYDGRGIGFRKALQEAGIPADPELCFEVDYVFQDITRLRKDIMSVKNRPTAIFAYNDDLASELMYELIESGYSIPGDVSIVGVNDAWYSPRLRVPLTTYHLPQDQIGLAVVEFLLNRLENPLQPSQKRFFEGHLFIRSSTGRAPH